MRNWCSSAVLGRFGRHRGDELLGDACELCRRPNRESMLGAAAVFVDALGTESIAATWPFCGRSDRRRDSARQHRTIAGCTAARSRRNKFDDRRHPLAIFARQAVGEHIQVAGIAGSPADFSEPFLQPTALFTRQAIAIQLERGDCPPRGDPQAMDVLNVVLGQVGRQRQAVRRRRKPRLERRRAASSTVLSGPMPSIHFALAAMASIAGW